MDASSMNSSRNPGSPSTPDNSEESAKKRLRFAPRTNQACTQCRRRKSRCSGGWPACEACTTRHEDCVYEGIRAPLSRSNEHPVRERQLPVLPTRPVAAPIFAGTNSEQDLGLQTEWRRKAISYFREHYAQTLLCFIPPQDLISDETGELLPRSLLLSILTLVSKFIPELEGQESDSLSASNRLAEATRKELRREYDKPSLATVQACLVLCIYEIGNGAGDQGWLRLGHAIRLAQLLNLHKLDSDNVKLPKQRSSQSSDSTTLLESKRRTFWCVFCLDRLLANGREKLAILWTESISTRLPQPDEDFIYGKKNTNETLRDGGKKDKEHWPTNESLFTYTIRVVNILGDITSWHGNGGRFADATSPWVDDMPFTILDRSLEDWRSSLPAHFDHSPSTVPLIVAVGQGRAWSFMFLLFHQARALLHREYLPFTSPKGYDPRNGPCDGPSLIADDRNPSRAYVTDWWLASVVKMVESANAISDLYVLMETKKLSPTAYPFPGFCLLNAATIHLQCHVYSWQVNDGGNDTHRLYLKKDLEACHKMSLRWPLAVHWIHQLTLYYKLNVLSKESWTGETSSRPEETLLIPKIRTDIINYIRGLDKDFRDRPVPSKNAEFDFASWIKILDESTAAPAIKTESASKGAATFHGPTNNAREGEENAENPKTLAMRFDKRMLGQGGVFDRAWWDNWSVEDWDWEVFK